MSRVEAFKEIQEMIKAHDKPVSPNIACAAFLEQIAGSLAVIADAMTEEKEGGSDGRNQT